MTDLTRTGFPNVMQPAPRQVYAWLLEPANQTGFGQHAGPCPCPNVKVSQLADGTTMCAGACVSPEGEPLGILDYEFIEDLLTIRRVRRFNRFEVKNLQIEFCGGMFIFHQPGEPQYTFVEDHAPEAVLKGDVLTMPDAQGFPCSIDFWPLDSDQ